MNRTPLYERHLALGGRMVEFAGYELPVQYLAGPIAEHNAVRNAAGLFDIDHMGQFEVRGPDAERYLQAIQPWDIAQMKEYEAHYSMLLYADGTLVDDIFLYRLPERWFVVVNAANRKKDLAWMEAHVGTHDVALLDVSDETCMIALQGPASERILQRLVQLDLSAVATRTAAETTLADQPALLGRTGYTGEDGFELYFPAEVAGEIWDAILVAGKDDGLLPCGLAARDSLRFEACMPLYGHELDASTNALEARLGWTVSWEKQFIGREALLKTRLEGPARLLIGFQMVDRAVPREHYAVAKDGKEIGHVTSGMKSPTLDAFLGLAYVPAVVAAIGTEFDIFFRVQPKKAVVVKRPFYKPKYK